MPGALAAAAGVTQPVKVSPLTACWQGAVAVSRADAAPWGRVRSWRGETRDVQTIVEPETACSQRRQLLRQCFCGVDAHAQGVDATFGRFGVALVVEVHEGLHVAAADEYPEVVGTGGMVFRVVAPNPGPVSPGCCRLPLYPVLPGRDACGVSTKGQR